MQSKLVDFYVNQAKPLCAAFTQVLTSRVIFSGQRRFPNAQRPVHLHPVGQLLRQVIREKRALARNSRVAFVCPKTREERAQERDGPVQDEGVGRATVGPQDQR